jgi:hypothetical protein
VKMFTKTKYFWAKITYKLFVIAKFSTPYLAARCPRGIYIYFFFTFDQLPDLHLVLSVNNPSKANNLRNYAGAQIYGKYETTHLTLAYKMIRSTTCLHV